MKRFEKQISDDFEEIWNLLHCIGAIDGKHTATECPKKIGSKYFSTTNAFLALFFWQSAMPNTASHL